MKTKTSDYRYGLSIILVRSAPVELTTFFHHLDSGQR